MPLWEQPLVLNIAKIVAGLIVVAGARVLGAEAADAQPARARAARCSHAASLPAAGRAKQVQRAERRSGSTPLAYEQQLAQARTLVGQDPKRVAQVVQNLGGQDE